jgi:hypothetical protein
MTHAHKQTISWLDSVKLITQTSGLFKTDGSQGQAINLNWNITRVQDSDFKNIMQKTTDLTVLTSTPVEIKFLQHYPEALQSEETHFKSIESLAANGFNSIDWTKATNLMATRIRTILDPMRWSDAVLNMFTENVFIVVTASIEGNSEIIATATFLITPEYRDGDMRITNLAIAPQAQNYNLVELLTSTVFLIAPHVQRLFTSIRSTNYLAISNYTGCGFSTDTQPIENSYHKMNPAHWVFLEYKANFHQELQLLSKALRLG